MAWTTPKTWTYGEVLYAADLNTALRDNMLETETAKAELPGYAITRSGNPEITMSKFEQAYVGDIMTLEFESAGREEHGPFLDVPRARGYLISFGARQHKVSGPGRVYVGPVIEGMFQVTSARRYHSASSASRGSATVLFNASSVPGLFPDYSADTYRFCLTYGSTGNGSVGAYAQRRLSVLPLGSL